MKVKLALFVCLVLGGMTVTSHAQTPSTYDVGTFDSFSAFQGSSIYSADYVEVTSLSQFLGLFSLSPDSLTSSEQALISDIYFGGSGVFYIDPSTGNQVLITSSSYPSSSGSSSSGVSLGETGLTTTSGFFALPGDQQMAAIMSAITAIDPDPQGTSQRTTQNLRSGAVSRLGGIHAGVEAPMLADEGGDSLHFEYNYIDSSLDTPAVGIASEANVFALGYERYLGGGIYLDLTYEYGDERLAAGATGINNDTHTVAASLSADLSNNIYGFLITGGSWSSGATNVGGAQLVGSNGSTFFINPGLGTSWTFGDIVVDGSVSYLYQNSSNTSVVAGIPVVGGAQLDQVIVDLGATYNFTDSLYARVGAQYNNIVDDNFGAGVVIDENWVQLNAELGVRIGASSNVYVGYGYDAGHNIYDVQTYRAGFSYGF